MSDTLNPPGDQESLGPPLQPRTVERGPELIGLAAVAATESEPLLPPRFFEDPNVISALANRDLGIIYRVAAQQLGLNQRQFGELIGRRQPEVSDVMNRRVVVTNYRIMQDCAERLHIPPEWMGLGYIAPGDDPRQQLEPGFAATNLPDKLLCDPRLHKVLQQQDISALYKILNQVLGIPQLDIAVYTGQGPPEVSAILNGREVRTYDTLLRICEGLGIPRGWMRLAYERPPKRLAIT